jgi:membrane protein DedA with SNARE-associated domain
VGRVAILSCPAGLVDDKNKQIKGSNSRVYKLRIDRELVLIWLRGSVLNEPIEFLIRHGYLLLFAWVLIEQMGLRVPAMPLLIAAGALAGLGKMNFVLAADYLGRYRGNRVSKLLCRISLEPDSCVRRTEGVFLRHGPHSLLVAKFVPGLNTAPST